jgi:hypothetical protein
MSQAMGITSAPSRQVQSATGQRNFPVEQTFHIFLQVITTSSRQP